eukprot:357606-Chlamydomonas_euryale.AAC.7
MRWPLMQGPPRSHQHIAHTRLCVTTLNSGTDRGHALAQTSPPQLVPNVSVVVAPASKARRTAIPFALVCAVRSGGMWRSGRACRRGSIAGEPDAAR